MNRLFPAQGQGALWIVFAAAGLIAGGTADLLRCFFGCGRFRAVGGMFAGAAFGLICFGLCVLCANGTPRAYMPLAMAAGAALYRATAGQLLRGICRVCGGVLLRMSRRIGSTRAVQRLLK